MERYLRKLRTFIQMGKSLAPLSTCKRLQVGVVIFPVDCSAIYAVGYNGPSRGLPNDTCTDETGHCGCAHAEGNALVKFNDNVAKPSIMYSTQSPCLYCAALILNCKNVVGLIWTETFRDNSGLQLILKSTNIRPVQECYLKDFIATLKYWKSLC